MPDTAKLKPIDYTEMAHHNELPDPNRDNDISSPQGEFWHRNERPGADSIKDVHLVREPSHQGAAKDDAKSRRTS